MCCLQWSLLPLLVLLLFRSPEMMRAENLSQQKVYAEALLAFKSAVGDPPTLSSWVGGEPCLKTWAGIQCSGMQQNLSVISLKLTGYKLDGFISPALQNLTSLVTLWLDDNHLRGFIPPGLGNLKNLTSMTLKNNRLRGSLPFDGAFSRVQDILVDGNAELCSMTGSFNLSTCGPSSAPALTFTSPQGPDGGDSGKSNSKVAAIVGGAAGSVVLVGLTIAVVCFCLMRAKSFSSRTSETGSSEPSAHDSDGNSLGKLDFRQRLSIAVGAAKGLEYLHGLTPLLVHKDFKTSNVLVDENFIAKVTDFGLTRLLAGVHDAGPSSPVEGFLDPEFNVSRSLHVKSDVYSFGVFLLELISGREAISLDRPGAEQHLVNWVSYSPLIYLL